MAEFDKTMPQERWTVKKLKEALVSCPDDMVVCVAEDPLPEDGTVQGMIFAPMAGLLRVTDMDDGGPSMVGFFYQPRPNQGEPN